MHSIRRVASGVVSGISQGAQALERSLGVSKPRPKALVRILRLEGLITSGQDPRTLSSRRIGPLVKKAFAIDAASRRWHSSDDERAKQRPPPGQTPKRPDAVALIINSPGGSPAQSSLICDTIIRAKKEAGNVPVLAFVEDVAASGGYYLACAADEVFVDENSILGSIGVINASLGLEDVVDRWGIKRRLTTAGKRKGAGDVLSPVDPEAQAQLQAAVNYLHERFKSLVTRRRGDRLGAVLRLGDEALLRLKDSFDGEGDGAEGDGASLLKEWEVEGGKRVRLMRPRADGSPHARMPEEWGKGYEVPAVGEVEDLFQGDVFPGTVAVHLGLADGLGAMEPVMRQRMMDAGLVQRAEDVVLEEVRGRRGFSAWLRGDFGSSFEAAAGRVGAAAASGALRSVRAEAEAASSASSFRA